VIIESQSTLANISSKLLELVTLNLVHGSILYGGMPSGCTNNFHWKWAWLGVTFSSMWRLLGAI